MQEVRCDVSDHDTPTMSYTIHAAVLTLNNWSQNNRLKIRMRNQTAVSCLIILAVVTLFFG